MSYVSWMSRARMGWTRGPACLLMPALVACSLTTVDFEPCEETSRCRATFGLGSTCEDGYCTEVEIHPRCNRAFPEGLLRDPVAYADYTLLGSLYSFVDHVDTLQATELAVRQVNAQTGLDGTRYAILHCDYTPMVGDALDDIAATEAVSTFMADELQLPAIIGPRGSARAEASYNAIRESDTVLISPSATSPALTALDGTTPTFEQPGHLWRTAPPDSLQSEVIAADMRSRNVTSVAVIYQSGAYGDGLKSLFVRRFGEAGGTTAEFPFTDDFSTFVADVAVGLTDGTYQEVMFVSSDIADYVAFLNAAGGSADLLAAYGQVGVGIFLSDTAYNPQLIEDTAALSSALFVNIRGTRPAPAEGPLFNAFAAAYSATFQQDATSSAYTPHSYDAAWLVIYGTAWSTFNEGGVTGTGIARGLRMMSNGTPVEIEPPGWTTAVDAFRNGRGINVQGASGPLDYDPSTEETSAPISLWHVIASEGGPRGYDFEELSQTQPN